MAFAIGGLDEVKKAGKLEELYDILPDSHSFSDKTVYEVCHSPDLIEKVTYMCKENMGETKETFQALINLLSEKRLREAKEYFRSELWRVIELYLKVNLRLEERRERVEEQKEQLLKSALPLSVLMVKNSEIDESRMEALEEEETKLREWEAKTILFLFEVGSITKEEGKRKLGLLRVSHISKTSIVLGAASLGMKIIGAANFVYTRTESDNDEEIEMIMREMNSPITTLSRIVNITGEAILSEIEDILRFETSSKL